MPYWFDGGHMIWMTLSWLIGILLLVGFLSVLFRAVRPGEAESPEAILRRRYAAGEIDTEEFERRLATLRKGKYAA
jgi:putative membrane protein